MVIYTCDGDTNVTRSKLNGGFGAKIVCGDGGQQRTCSDQQNKLRIHNSFLFPATLILRFAGPEGAKNLAGEVLRLIQIRLARPILKKSHLLVKKKCQASLNLHIGLV